jgi:hypothetical protein
MLPRPIYVQFPSPNRWHIASPLPGFSMPRWVEHTRALHKQLYCLLSEVCFSTIFLSYLTDCSGWDGFAPASNAPSDRPAFGGTCFTNIYSVPIQITSYDKSAIKASSIFTATGTSDQAYAYPYEGFALGVAVLASTTRSSQATETSKEAFSPFEESDTGSGGMSHGAVAGLVLGCIIIVLLLVTLVVFALSYRQKRLTERRMPFSLYNSHIRFADSPTPLMYMDINEMRSSDSGLYSGKRRLDDKKSQVELEAPRPSTLYEMEAAPLPVTKTKQLPDLPKDPQSP